MAIGMLFSGFFSTMVTITMVTYYVNRVLENILYMDNVVSMNCCVASNMAMYNMCTDPRVFSGQNGLCFRGSETSLN